MKALILAAFLASPAFAMEMPTPDINDDADTEELIHTRVQCIAGSNEAPGNRFFALGTGVSYEIAQQQAAANALRDCQETVGSLSCVIVSCSEY